jgi:hypothetical protein
MNEAYQNGKEIKIAVLQEQVKEVQSDVTKILDNHLPHIYDRLGSVEKKIAYYTGGMAIIVIIAQAIIQKL